MIHYPTWGMSWLGSWGSSWGPIEVEDKPQGGGIGHGHKGATDRRTRSKRKFLERNGKILIFKSADDAEAYIQAEQEQKKVEPKKKKTKARKIKLTVTVEEIEVKQVQRFMDFSGMKTTVHKVMGTKAADFLAIVRKAMEWEDDQLSIILMVS